jgi:hypothetical protein
MINAITWKNHSLDQLKEQDVWKHPALKFLLK